MLRFIRKSRPRRFIEYVIPQKGDGKREIARKILFIVAVAVLIFGLWLLISYYAASYQNNKEYATLKNIHESAVSKSSASSASSAGNGVLSEFTSLYRQNKEIKGWITIPKTNIDYPVVQTTDNKKYLHVNFNQQRERHGALFLDFRDTIKPLSHDLIIYGHNIGDGQMFSQLGKYERRDGNDYVGFYNSSPLITFDTLYEHSKWKIFAVFVTAADSTYSGSLYYLDTEFDSQEKFNSFITNVRKRSFINTSVDVKPTDKLLTLSTCDYVYPETKDGEYARLVVMARKVRDGESEKVAIATKNTNIVFPDYYYKVWGE